MSLNEISFNYTIIGDDAGTEAIKKRYKIEENTSMGKITRKEFI